MWLVINYTQLQGFHIDSVTFATYLCSQAFPTQMTSHAWIGCSHSQALLGFCHMLESPGPTPRLFSAFVTRSRWYPLSMCCQQVHTKWLPGVRLRHFSSTCAVRVEDYECWWLFGCRSSLAEHWLLKPSVLGPIPSNCRPLHFSLFSPQNI